MARVPGQRTVESDVGGGLASLASADLDFVGERLGNGGVIGRARDQKLAVRQHGLTSLETRQYGETRDDAVLPAFRGASDHLRLVGNGSAGKTGLDGVDQGDARGFAWHHTADLDRLAIVRNRHDVGAGGLGILDLFGDLKSGRHFGLQGIAHCIGGRFVGGFANKCQVFALNVGGAGFESGQLTEAGGGSPGKAVWCAVSNVGTID